MKIKSINVLMLALTIHIFSVYCRLLFYLNPEVQMKLQFSFLRIDEPTMLAMVFALSYSMATIFVVFKTNKKSLILLYAILDTIGVLLYYFARIPLYFGAIYFALYTGSLIISLIYLKTPDFLSDKVHEMKEQGISQKEIVSASPIHGQLAVKRMSCHYILKT